MNSPFISICIPAYKRPGLLKKLLDSVGEQTYKNFEIIINDNSPDDSVEKLVAGYATVLPIDYVKNEPAVNAAGNCIQVMRRARAPWIKLMHDDDWFASPDALEKFVTAAVNSGCSFIFSACNKVDLETGRAEASYLSAAHRQMLDQSVLSLFYLNVIGHPSVAMHKKDTAVEYDAGFSWVLDIDFYMRYLQQHNSFYYINERLVNIGKSAGQESFKYYKNAVVEIPEYFRLLTKFDPALPLQNQFVFHLVWNMLQRYKIKDTAQIRALGFDGPLPVVTDIIIRYQKRIPRIILKQPRSSAKLMLRCYNKVRAQGLYK